jgi:hypothetical protein
MTRLTIPLLATAMALGALQAHSQSSSSSSSSGSSSSSSASSTSAGSVSNPRNCRVVDRKSHDSGSTGSMSSSVTAGGGKVTGHWFNDYVDERALADRPRLIRGDASLLMAVPSS